MVKIEINGVSAEAEAGSTIIQVADQLAIPIPRFCYHHKLSIAANCRMCLVQVEKSNKPLPACATPIVDGMKVWTASKEAIEAQKSVMEFLLINHPLDCPICDQGGECELQDVSMDYGNNFSRYDQPKRVVLDKNLGPLVATDMTRCIQCTRCVRFGEEIAGQRELGAVGRSEFMAITTFIEQNVNSEVSGNIIDLCPVGALTSKPFRFRARAWELRQYPSIAMHDCIGSNVYMHVFNNAVMRVVPKQNEALNEVWLSDRDRFSYEAFRHHERLAAPMICKKVAGAKVKPQVTSWTEALRYALAGIKICIDNYGANQFGVLATPNASIEEYYLLQKLARGFGTINIDHRLRQQDFSMQAAEPLYPNLGIKVAELSSADGVLLIGSNLHKEQPLAGIRLRKATLHGGKVCVLNPVDFTFNFALSAKAIVHSDELLNTMAGIAKAISDQQNVVVDMLTKVKPDSNAKRIAEQLLLAKRPQVILGQLALMHPQAASMMLLANLIAKLTNGNFGYFPQGANTAGAYLAGCVPHRLVGGKPSKATGKNAWEMLQQPLKCYILYGIEPEFDSLLGTKALETIRQADFVVVFSAYQSASLLEIADVILPLALFSESFGSAVNIDGTWQSHREVVPPFGESRPGWKILRVLGSLADLNNFTYETPQEILADIQQQVEMPAQLPRWSLQTASEFNLQFNGQFNVQRMKGLTRIAPIGLYSTDSIVRRAVPLQQTQDAIGSMQVPSIQLNSKTAASLNLVPGELALVTSEYGSVKLTVVIDDQVADQNVVIPQANAHTNALGAPYALVEVSKC